MIRRWGWLWIFSMLFAVIPASRADQFELMDGPMLARLIKGTTVTARPGLTMADLGAMPALLRDSRSALVLAKTEQGNLARMLLSVELRKPASGVGEPTTVVVVERLDTFDAAEHSTRLTTRKDILLFDGFLLDLDTGQVVPTGHGGDLTFHSGANTAPRLDVVGPATMYTLSQAPTFDDSKVPQPTPGRAVVPADFAGRYRLFANGQWSGTLDLQVGQRGVVTGKFRSDLHGTAYPVTGQAGVEVPQKLQFAISFPRARQEFEGYLWGEGKGAMAGTASLLDRPSGFFAVREGARYAPEGRDLGPLERADADRPGKHLVEIQTDRISLDGKAASLEELNTRLKSPAQNEEAAWVLIRVKSDVKYQNLAQVIDAIKNAGINQMRFDQKND